MKSFSHLAFVVLILLSTVAWSQSAGTEPHIGSIYPAGGQRGTVFNITVRGQSLRGADGIYITGEGISAKVIRHYRTGRNIQREQAHELMARLIAQWDKRFAKLSAEEKAAMSPAQRFWQQKRNVNQKQAKDIVFPKGFKPLDHPLLHDLEDQSLRQVQNTFTQIFFPNQKKQINAQLREIVLLEVTIAPDAALGDREWRLRTPWGLSNPMCFQVGQLPESTELEPNDPQKNPLFPEAPGVELPMLFNGRIMPGDVDLFRFRARRGLPLMVKVQARHLDPFLADTVPGWFQPTVALYDTKGHELAFDDDNGFDPDPVLVCDIAEDGEYTIEIRDAIYRGREDFVYRIAVGEQAFIRQAFSSGEWKAVPTQLPAGPMPQIKESEPNDDIQNAQRIELPGMVSGCIASPGDVDAFQIEGKAGHEIVAEVFGRRLMSPIDSILRLTDATGKVLAWNDDYEKKDGQLRTDMGVLTHHADSYLSARLPGDGVYYVSLADAQGNGGQDFHYRLRLGAPQPDFALSLTPSTLNIPAGDTVPITDASRAAWITSA